MTSCICSSRAFENPPVLMTSPPSTREVGNRATRVVGAALRLLPVLLATERGLVEEVVGAARRLRAARERRVGVEHVVADAEEATLPGLLARFTGHEESRLAALFVLGLRPVVVFDRRDRLVERDVEVVVEVAAERRIPGERPTPLGLVDLDLGQGRPRPDRERRVACVELGE